MRRQVWALNGPVLFDCVLYTEYLTDHEDTASDDDDDHGDDDNNVAAADSDHLITGTEDKAFIFVFIAPFELV